MIGTTEPAHQVWLGTGSHPVEKIHLQAALCPEESGQQADRACPGHQNSTGRRLEPQHAPVDLLPSLGNHARRLDEDTQLTQLLGHRNGIHRIETNHPRGETVEAAPPPPPKRSPAWWDRRSGPEPSGGRHLTPGARRGAVTVDQRVGGVDQADVAEGLGKMARHPPRRRVVLRAINQRPCSGPPSRAAKQAPQSNRGRHSQSIDPLRHTSCRLQVADHGRSPRSGWLLTAFGKGQRTLTPVLASLSTPEQRRSTTFARFHDDSGRPSIRLRLSWSSMARACSARRLSRSR